MQHDKTPNFTFFFNLSLQLSLPNTLKPRCYVENEDVVGAALAGDAPPTSERSTILLPTKMWLVQFGMERIRTLGLTAGLRSVRVNWSQDNHWDINQNRIVSILRSPIPASMNFAPILIKTQIGNLHNKCNSSSHVFPFQINDVALCEYS